MANEPLIGDQDRPDLTIDMEGKVGDLTVRELTIILGVDPAAYPKNKREKELKDRLDNKEARDRKYEKDQKEPKDQKDQKDQKDSKDHKEQKDTKDIRDVGIRSPKPDKDHKDQKDLIEVWSPQPKGPAESGHGPVQDLGELDQLIKRVSGLEQAVEELKGLKK